MTLSIHPSRVSRICSLLTAIVASTVGGQSRPSPKAPQSNGAHPLDISIEGFRGSGRLDYCFSNATSCGGELYGGDAQLEYRGNRGWAGGVAIGYYGGLSLTLAFYPDDPAHSSARTEKAYITTMDARLFARRYLGPFFVELGAGMASMRHPAPTWCDKLDDAYRGTWICGFSVNQTRKGLSGKVSAGLEVPVGLGARVAVEASVAQMTSRLDYARHTYSDESGFGSRDERLTPKATILAFGLRLRP
jgi:hypothetical protein